MYSFLRAILFQLDPEQAHALALGMIRLAGKLAPVRAGLRLWFNAPARPVQAFGLQFANPIGLAAGYDKDAAAWRGLASLGFGHIEVGTVTPRPQPGNPRPRLFRLPEAQALINRMGFPGKGARVAAANLAPGEGRRPAGLVVGVNLGKNKSTPLEEAARDYLELLDIFTPLADYLVVNVSSPNTEGLRQLQARRALDGLLSQLTARQESLFREVGQRPPLLVKLAPDLNDAELDDFLQAVQDNHIAGVIATNTTVSRPGLDRLSPSRANLLDEKGGLSGAPLRAMSTEMIKKIVQRTGASLPVVGVGGVLSAEDAREKLDAGACLVQVYTGLVYQGPGMVKKILAEL